MISTDFYEGIRPAQQVDLDSIEGLLRPLAQAGVTKARSRESLMRDLHSFTVLERESEVLPLNISHCTAAIAVIAFRLLDAWVYKHFAVKVCLLGAVTCNQSQCLHMHVTRAGMLLVSI